METYEDMMRRIREEDKAYEAEQEKNGEVDLRRLFSRCVTREDWEAMIASQVAQAREGNLRAFELLLEHAFGKATVYVPPEEKPEPIRFITVYSDGKAEEMKREPLEPVLPENAEAEEEGEGWCK